MRLRALSTTAGAVLLTALTLAACGPGGGKAADNGHSTSSSPTPSSEGKDGDQGKQTGSSGSSTNGGGSSTSGSSGDSEAVDSCTAKNTELQFLLVKPGNDRQDAQANVRVTNTGSETCTIVGVTTLNAKDITGRATTVETDNSGGSDQSVDVAPGKTVVSLVEYMDRNNDGTGSEDCALEAHEVHIALPDDEARTVEVKRKGDEAASFLACAPEKVKFGDFGS